MKRVRLLDAAALDLKEGFDFYEQQESGLGGYFLDSLFSDIDSLLIHAGVHPTYFLSYYRMLSKRFPFAVYYRIDGNNVLVYAVLDCRKSPAWIRSRMKKT
jgi:plasmid stabilization system protein ParE